MNFKINNFFSRFSGNKDLLFSLIIYGGGLSGMFLSDIYVVSNFSVEKISEWAFIKSTILIVSTLCLMGYDQLFIRDQTLIKRRFPRFIKHSLIIIFVACIGLYFLRDYSIIKVFLLAVCFFLMAIQNYITSASRGNYRLWKSQFSANGWKVFLLAFLLVNPDWPVFVYYLGVLVLSLTCAFFFKGYSDASSQFKTKESLNDKEAFSMGLSFLLHSLTLVFAVYGEQFIINLFEADVSSSHLFRYVSIFTPIALSLNGFLGFYLGPKIRLKNNSTHGYFRKLSAKIFIYTVLTVVISFLFGFYYFRYYLNTQYDQLDYMIIAILFLLCIIRGMYIATSVTLGIFGNSKQLLNSAKYTWVSTIFYLLLIILVLSFFNGIFAAQLVCGATLINWILRFFISNIYTAKALKKQNIE